MAPARVLMVKKMIENKDSIKEITVKNPWLTGARISIVIVLLALIRSMAEFFRLEYIHSSTLTVEQIRPFIVGSIIAAAGCLVMTIFSFYSKNKVVIAMFLLTITSMLIVKIIYHLS
jgi:hypothetical protein